MPISGVGREERRKAPGGPVGLTAKKRVIRETHALVKGKVHVLEAKLRWIQVSDGRVIIIIIASLYACHRRDVQTKIEGKKRRETAKKNGDFF